MQTDDGQPSAVAVAPESDLPSLVERAQNLANSLDLRITSVDETSQPLLVVTPARLELRNVHRDIAGPVFVDLLAGSSNYRRRHRSTELIAKAVGYRNSPLNIIDCTIGFGQDAYVLAWLGCRVYGIERSPVVAEMLRDGLERAASQGSADIRESVRRISVTVGDARELLGQLSATEKPDAIYLDPMYAVDKKRTAQVKKEMRACRILVGDDLDAAELLDAALAVECKRTVVKRMIQAPPLKPNPDIQYTGRAIRYDVYL